MRTLNDMSTVIAQMLKATGRAQLYTRLVAAVVLVGLVLLPVWGGRGAMTFFVTLCFYAAMAQMWNLLAGFAGLITIGQQVFVGLGGYGMVILAELWGLDVWVAIVGGAVSCALLAVPIGMLTFRLRGGYFAVGTWVVAEVFRLGFGNWEYVGMARGLFVRGARGIPPTLIYYAALALAVGAILGVVWLLRSRLGLALTAIRDNEDASGSLGVDVYRAKMICFVLAAFGTGLTAAIMYVHTPFIQPNDAFSINWVVAMIFIVIVGGIGTVEGPLLGALLYVGIQQQLTAYGPVALIILGVVAVGVMLYAPRGLGGVLVDRYGASLFSMQRRFVPGSTNGEPPDDPTGSSPAALRSSTQNAVPSS